MVDFAEQRVTRVSTQRPGRASAPDSSTRARERRRIGLLLGRHLDRPRRTDWRSRARRPTPLPVPSAPALSWVSVGVFTTCGADASGFAYCWEGNPRGEMGNGTEDGSITPQRVATDLEFVQLSAGIVQTCGVVTSGQGYCWGDDTFGQLGVIPSLLSTIAGASASVQQGSRGGRRPAAFTEISTGPGSHSCGVTTRGNLYCWGLGLSGQRGDGTAPYAISVPIQVKDP